MRKLIAVRATDVGDELLLEGFVVRGKNRECVWRIMSENGDQLKLREAINKAEEKRELAEAPPEPGVPPLKS